MASIPVRMDVNINDVVKDATVIVQVRLTGVSFFKFRMMLVAALLTLVGYISPVNVGIKWEK